ncbi:AMP-binding protein [Paracoccus sp. Ld10]|uniref:AMP-binding protein n=1 Tax=Paracoccus sp. Ld10 TaxID=649158 RepID=UPI00386FEE55
MAYQHNRALDDRDHQLSYGQLASFVLAFQSRLDVEGPIALFGTPSTLLAAAAVSCVISGRPFVHLDPAMPQAVLGNIVDELQIGTIVTCQPGGLEKLPTHCSLLAAQACLEDTANTDIHRLVAADVRPTDAIYLVATSGTTGRPKCIPVTHDAAYLSYQWRDAYTPYAATMNVGIYIFAIWEMFRPLRNGARLCFPDTNDLMAPQGLVSFLSRHRIDEMLFTPSFFQKALRAIDPKVGADLPLRRVILNGEVVDKGLIAEARQKLPNVALWNLYSICETHDVSMIRLTGTEGASVGIAMPHLSAVVLDDHDLPCSAGQPGLLHFEGPRMLGPGYVNRPQETAERFRVLTLEGQNRRLYDTGDQGLVTADGQIHVLGRIAHMLKLRGHSIQTRELTETLGQHIDFARAIPWVQQIDGQGQVLVFYYTADAEQTARNADRWTITAPWQRTPQILAEALQRVLPRYCTPTYLVRMDEIPIHPVSGKCDFKALPQTPPHQQTVDDDDTDALAVTVSTARILGCPVSHIDMAVSFHDHGGDSLMCVDLLLSLEAAYNRPVDFDWALNLPLERLHRLLTEDPDIAAQPGVFHKKGILLTGATGFLGGHVLAEAARHLPDDQVIYCLVRPRNNDPLSRLAARAEALGVPQHRVVVVAGSIEAPSFGLKAQDYARLTGQVSAVIHCAATVNLALDRERMESASQAGIATVLQFCKDAKARLAFSSSTSIFPDAGGPFPETATEPFDGISGYGAAKIAAEHAIAASGVAAMIARLPSLYDLNDPNPKDIYETILKACRLSGCTPRDMCFRMTDVRAAARLLVRAVVPNEVVYCNLIADDAVTDAGGEAVSMLEWVETAPLSAPEYRLLRDNPTILRADAIYDNAIAHRLWDTLDLGYFAQISDVRELLVHRLGSAPEPATTVSRR